MRSGDAIAGGSAGGKVGVVGVISERLSSGWGLPRSGPGCNFCLIGLFTGLVAGEDFACVNLVGVGILDSLAVGLCAGLAFATVLLGVVPMVLVVTAFGLAGGGLISVSVPPRTEYGPAVAGRGAISGRFLVGRTGATESPPLVVGF